jgi:N-acetylmuramoyl-L-alanine amidase
MLGAHPRLEWYLATLAVAVCAGAAVIASGRPGSPDLRAAPAATALPPPVVTTPGPTQATVVIEPNTAGAATTRGPTAVHQTPHGDAPPVSYLRAGIVLPVDGHIGPFVRVFTPCEATGWVHTRNLVLHPKSTRAPASWEDATIVLDPGHGGLQTGAIGPGGLREKDANLAITKRLTAQLGGARVFGTRDADFTAGLRYRTRIATALHAHAFISIHNNSVPDGPSRGPGTETWHQSQSVPSQQLSQLIWGELVEALQSFKVSWVADRKAGTRTRLGHDGHDYYAILRGSTVPAVIVEAMFISNAQEEALLRRPEGQDAVAGALARSLRSYVDASGPDVAQPYATAPVTTGGLPPTCVDPV